MKERSKDRTSFSCSVMWIANLSNTYYIQVMWKSIRGSHSNRITWIVLWGSSQQPYNVIRWKSPFFWLVYVLYHLRYIWVSVPPLVIVVSWQSVNEADGRIWWRQSVGCNDLSRLYWTELKHDRSMLTPNFRSACTRACMNKRNLERRSWRSWRSMSCGRNQWTGLLQQWNQHESDENVGKVQCNRMLSLSSCIICLPE